MAITSNRVTVTTSPVALTSGSPTVVRVWNTGSYTVYVGPTGAGNQRYPVESGEEAVFNLVAADVLFGVVEAGSPAGQVAVFYSV